MIDQHPESVVSFTANNTTAPFRASAFISVSYRLVLLPLRSGLQFLNEEEKELINSDDSAILELRYPLQSAEQQTPKSHCFKACYDAK